MAHFKFLQWLADWILAQEGFSFEWDEGNIKKSLEKHLRYIDNMVRLIFDIILKFLIIEPIYLDSLQEYQGLRFDQVFFYLFV